MYEELCVVLQMYETDAVTGVVHLSFSVDATCQNQLTSPYEGYETMVLNPKRVIQPPDEVKSHACVFPDWARGKWQHLEVRFLLTADNNCYIQTHSIFIKDWCIVDSSE